MKSLNLLFSTLGLCICIGFLQGGYGQQRNTVGQIRAITTAVPFLSITPNSWSGALGEAGVAFIDDANALYMNPSVLAFTPYKFGFSINYTPWLRNIVPDINHAFVPFYYSFGDKGGVAGISLTYFSLGEIDFRDGRSNYIGSSNPNEFAISASYARKITDIVSAGVSLRYIHSQLVGSGASVGMPIQDGQSVAGDVNFFMTKDFKFRNQLDMNFSWGFNITNIGAKMNYSDLSAQKDFLPTNLKIGYALTAKIDEHNSLSLVNDFNKLLVPTPNPADPTNKWKDKDVMSGIFGSFGDAPGGFGEELSEITTSLGLEYWYNLRPNERFFAARAGYFYEDPNKGNRKFITLGAGLRFNIFSIDFAFLAPLSQNHPLQNTLRFSIGFNFSSNKPQ
ncbi:MAG: type IX secretion system outer membrane channel protein PorV [Bacteroidia bacterium]|nr:type IX secretion system outer membrane channel protein PorV [Bacteroidia bacterium]MDW8158227.1 type IX secretion system outer membrane channel protein PorV [Bacteroidia bacterium]